MKINWIDLVNHPCSPAAGVLQFRAISRQHPMEAHPPGGGSGHLSFQRDIEARQR